MTENINSRDIILNDFLEKIASMAIPTCDKPAQSRMMVYLGKMMSPILSDAPSRLGARPMLTTLRA